MCRYTKSTSLGHKALTYSSGKMCLKNSSYSIVPLWSSSNLNCTWALTNSMFVESVGEIWTCHTHTSLVQAWEEAGNQKQAIPLQFVGWNQFTNLCRLCIYIKRYTEMYTLLNRAPRAKCTSRYSLCTWHVNILSCRYCPKQTRSIKYFAIICRLPPSVFIC